VLSLICTHGDYKAMRLINCDTHGLVKEFDKILITPCFVGQAANHENNNHLECCHSRESE
jgi:hypothetical protein